MDPDRFRLFTKRGAALGVLAVIAATVSIVVAGALISALLLLAF